MPIKKALRSIMYSSLCSKFMPVQYIFFIFKTEMKYFCKRNVIDLKAKMFFMIIFTKIVLKKK